jgi:hypothetical protein
MKNYVLVDFPAGEEGAGTFGVYLSWGDFESFLNLPQKERRLHDRACVEIRAYLGADKFGGYAQHYGLSIQKLFFNVVPLFVNAAATIVPLIKIHIQGSSTESTAFADHFSTVQMSDTRNPDVRCGPFVLPN